MSSNLKIEFYLLLWGIIFAIKMVRFQKNKKVIEIQSPQAFPDPSQTTLHLQESIPEKTIWENHIFEIIDSSFDLIVGHFLKSINCCRRV